MDEQLEIDNIIYDIIANDIGIIGTQKIPCQITASYIINILEKYWPNSKKYKIIILGNKTEIILKRKYNIRSYYFVDDHILKSDTSPCITHKNNYEFSVIFNSINNIYHGRPIYISYTDLRQINSISFNYISSSYYRRQNNNLKIIENDNIISMIYCKNHLFQCYNITNYNHNTFPYEMLNILPHDRKCELPQLQYELIDYINIYMIDKYSFNKLFNNDYSSIRDIGLFSKSARFK